MVAITPPAEMVAETEMLTTIFRTILQDSLVDPRRLSKAATLLAHVERTATPGLWLVRSGSRPDLAHRVQHGLCSCEDAGKRDARRCCHALAVKVFEMSERAAAEQTDPTPPCRRHPAETSAPCRACAQGDPPYCARHWATPQYWEDLAADGAYYCPDCPEVGAEQEWNQSLADRRTRMQAEYPIRPQSCGCFSADCGAAGQWYFHCYVHDLHHQPAAAQTTITVMAPPATAAYAALDAETFGVGPEAA